MQSSLSQLLVAEHQTILEAGKHVYALSKQWEFNPTEYHLQATKIIDFLSVYADEFHHNKEEEIVFPAISRKNELVGNGIVQELIEQHEDFRLLAQQIRMKLHLLDFAAAQKYFEMYINKLRDHIAAENEELFPMADSIFTQAELDKLYYQCIDKDLELGIIRKEELENSLQNFKHNEPVQ